jgi:hypothetical protein
LYTYFLIRQEQAKIAQRELEHENFLENERGALQQERKRLLELEQHLNQEHLTAIDEERHRLEAEKDTKIHEFEENLRNELSTIKSENEERIQRDKKEHEVFMQEERNKLKDIETDLNYEKQLLLNTKQQFDHGKNFFINYFIIIFVNARGLIFRLRSQRTSQ